MSKIIKTSYIKDSIAGVKVDSSLPCKKGYFTEKSSRSCDYVTIHFTGNVTDKAKSNANYYNRSINREASAHLFVDDTSIYQSVKLKDQAWSVGASKYYHDKCRNGNQISIELCDTNGQPSDKTIVLGSYVCAYLMDQLGKTANDVDKYVLRHYDVTHKACPYKATWIDKPDKFVRFKNYVKSIMSKEYAVNAKDGLNVRAEADSDSKLKGTLKDKTKVRCYQTKKVGNYTWGKVYYNGLVGWINLYYTK